MHASSRFSRFVSLRIEGWIAEESESGQAGGGLGSPTTVGAEVLPVGYLPSLGKGKGKISEIRYPYGSEYLRATVRYVDAVGPFRVKPLYAKTFTACYRPPPVVRIWCPDILTSYVVPVPNMVCFFEAAFENVSSSLCTLSSKASYNISMCARPSSLPIFGASWSAFWFFSWIRALGSLV